ncbi:hypothetical protein [Fontibacillus sp. BL9]|uniref:hypothetical protein n=1 Tax=Fontibacillus sp. BL9 TaxID=3389971 RepID=UPI00397CF706
MKRANRKLAFVLMLIMVIGLFGSAASANEAYTGAVIPENALKEFGSLSLQALKSPSLESLQQDITTIEQVDVEQKKGIAVERPFVTQAVYETPDSILNVTDSLQVGDPEEMIFFSVNTDRSMVLKLLSSNVDYLAQLYIVDWNTGQAYPTSVGAYAQTQIALKNLPAGDYLLRIYSGGSVGETYNLSMNAANPSNYNNLVYYSDTLNVVLASYSNGDLYSNGTFIYNSQSGSAYSNLDWTREYYFSWGSGYRSRTHKVYNPIITGVSVPVSYSSSYASSSRAILLYVGENTGFMHHEAYYQSGPDHIYESSFYDTLGKRTPRSLDAEDMNWDHILVYDLNTNKTIDFYSVLNYYYAAGIEPAPTVSPL